MIFILITAIIALILLRDLYVSDGYLQIEIAILVALAGAAIGMLFSLIVSFNLPSTQVPGERIELYTLKRGDPVLEGRFFLGSGFVESKPVWEYNILVSRDPITLDGSDVPANSRYYQIRQVLDQKTGKAYLFIYHNEYAEPWFKYIALFPNDRGPTLYEFHLPVDAVIPDIQAQP